MSPSGEVLAEYDLPNPGSRPWDIVAGPDGALWFTEIAGNRIGRITVDGEITEYDLPTPNALPNEIELGPNGTLVFSEQAAGKIGLISMDGAITEYDVPTPNSQPVGLVARGNKVWFAETTGNAIGRLTLAGADRDAEEEGDDD